MVCEEYGDVPRTIKSWLVKISGGLGGNIQRKSLTPAISQHISQHQSAVNLCILQLVELVFLALSVKYITVKFVNLHIFSL